MNYYWIPYLCGMFLPLGFKLGHKLYLTDKTQATFWGTVAGFVFADADASFKTTLNLAAELVLGAIYIDNLPAPFMPTIEFPQHWAAVFFVAFAAELIVPFAINSIVDWTKRKITKMTSG